MLACISGGKRPRRLPHVSKLQQRYIITSASADAGTTSITLDTIEVISQELNAARLQIQPSLGASTYYFGSEALETIPQGENAPLNQVLLQMPGDLGLGQGTELRLDVLNIGDAVYEIRNGTGVGVGAPQFGIRRAILAGLTQRF